MNLQDRLVSLGGQASYSIASILGMVNPLNYGVNYYVDGNASASGQGNSWESPYNSLIEALAASSAEIAVAASRHWAKRNAIWVIGDDIVEDLDLLAQKTDIIGCGSSDPYAMACIRGNHVPTLVTGLMGNRFINMRFRPTASEDLFTIDSTTGGLAFHGCLFDANYSTFTAPSAIDATGAQFLTINGSEFMGAFSENYIDIGAGRVDQMRIVGNIMLGSAVNGIMVTDTTTVVQGRLGLISKNTIYCPGITIDDGDNDTFIVTDNVCVSDAATGTASIDCDIRWAARNHITDGSKAGPYPRLDDT
jgi:hypothetical protein